jgi:RNA polymerase sigma-70 factor (ECF subfamily)
MSAMEVVAWNSAMAVETPDSPESEEARLIAACRGGDPDAFADLVRLHERRVFKLAGRFFKQRDEVDEAAQETFVTVWSKLHTYRGDAPFEHWLTRVCLNCCYARLRKARPTEEIREVRFEAQSGDPNARVEVEGLLKALPAHDRFLLQLMYGEGWAVAEIADKLGWSRTNVKVRAHRARKKLRKLLEQES